MRIDTATLRAWCRLLPLAALAAAGCAEPPPITATLNVERVAVGGADATWGSSIPVTGPYIFYESFDGRFDRWGFPAPPGAGEGYLFTAAACGPDAALLLRHPIDLSRRERPHLSLKAAGRAVSLSIQLQARRPGGDWEAFTPPLRGEDVSPATRFVSLAAFAGSEIELRVKAACDGPPDPEDGLRLLELAIVEAAEGP